MVQHPSKQIMSQLIKRQWNLHSIQAAVVNSKGEIFSIGETTVADDHDPTAHAEVNAIRKACQQLGTSELPKEYWLYSTFEPCPLCSSAAVWAGVEGIVFANNSNFRGKEQNWSFISCREVLEAGACIHEVKLVLDFMIDDIKGYFTRHDE